MEAAAAAAVAADVAKAVTNESAKHAVARDRTAATVTASPGASSSKGRT
jgi:hypothetical protein